MKLLEKFKNAKTNKKKFRFIITFIGTMFFFLSIMICMGISSYSVYITSYFHHNNISIDMQYSHLINPIMFFANSTMAPLAGFLEKKIGLYLSLIMSFILVELGIILFINQMNILLSFIIIILLGISCGIATPLAVKNLFLYYQKNTGIISALVRSVFILYSSILGIIGEKVINPDKYTLAKDEQFYPLDISKNYLTFFKYIILINPFFILLSMILIKKYDSQYDEDLLSENENTTNNDITDLKKGKKQKNENHTKNIKSALFHKRIWKLMGVLVFTSFSLHFGKNTFRVYGALTSISGAILQYSSVFTGFSTIFVGPIWGYIVDKYKYEIISKILCSCFILQTVMFSIFTNNNIIYIICIFFGSLLESGFLNLNKTHIVRVYGIEYSVEFIGITNLIGGIFNILISLLSFILSKFFHTGEELQFAYRFVYIAGIVIVSIGFFLSYREKGDQFVYPYSTKEEDFINMVNSDFIEQKRKESTKRRRYIDLELELESNSSEITKESN